MGRFVSLSTFPLGQRISTVSIFVAFPHRVFHEDRVTVPFNFAILASRETACGFGVCRRAGGSRVVTAAGEFTAVANIVAD